MEATKVKSNSVGYQEIFNLCFSVKVLLDLNKEYNMIPQGIADKIEYNLNQIKIGDLLNGN